MPDKGHEVKIDLIDPEVNIDVPDKSTQKARELETSLKSEGQRTTSMLWETTQKQIALYTIGLTLFSAVGSALFGEWLKLGNDVRIAAFVFLYGAANLVIGFYFGRTNHQRVGGPGGDSAGVR